MSELITLAASRGYSRQPVVWYVADKEVRAALPRFWGGRYSPSWPDIKKHARSVYAHSGEECEKLLAEMIPKMKLEIAAEQKRLKATPKAG